MEIERIAKGLTKAQREALLQADVTFAMYERLAASKLVNMWQLTPLGLAVRAYLMENPDEA